MERMPLFCGGRLKQARREKGISQKNAAVQLGVTEVGYQNCEAGRRNPSLEMLSRLAKFFNVSTDYLLGLSDEPQLPDKDEWAMLKQMRAYRDKQAAAK